MLAWAWPTMLVSASLAIQSTSRDSRWSSGTGRASADEPDLKPADALRPRHLGAQRRLERAAVERRRGEPEQRQPGLDERLAGDRARLPQMVVGARPAPADPRGRAVDVHPHADQPLRERVVQLGEHAVALGRDGLGPGALLGRLVHPGVGQRDRRVLGEQPQQVGVVRPERAPLVPAEDDAGADDAAAPFERHADHAAQRRP